MSLRLPLNRSPRGRRALPASTPGWFGRWRNGKRGVAAEVVSQTTTAAPSNPVRVIATLLVVPAIVGTFALPAFAATTSVATSAQSTADAGQQVTGAPDAAATVSSDSYVATTKTQISASQRSSWAAGLAARGSVGDYAVQPVRQPGDDYPWYAQGLAYAGLSPLSYYYGECVDFVAWRLNRDAGVTGAPWKWTWATLGAGNASSWASAWVRHGWPTSSVPVPGAVAWFPGNHVGYVNSVNADGSVNLEEYNYGYNHRYHTRTIPANSALYLYPPPK